MASPDDRGNGLDAADHARQPGGSLNIMVEHAVDQAAVHIRMSQTTQMKKLFCAFSTHTGRPERTLRFFYEDTLVAPDDSPETLGMADGDTIDVFKR